MQLFQRTTKSMGILAMDGAGCLASRRAQDKDVTHIAAAPFTYVDMTSELVGAYVASSHVPPAEMPALIRSVHDTLADLDQPARHEYPRRRRFLPCRSGSP